MSHTNEVIVCNSEREKRIAEIVMEQPLGCWGNIPTKVVIGETIEGIVGVVIATETANVKSKELRVVDEVRQERKKTYTDDVIHDGTRYITFQRFMSYWLEDRA